MKLLSLLFTLFLVQAASAKSFFIAPVQGVGNSELKQTVKALFTNSVSNQGNNVVSSKDQADAILRPSVLKLGNSYLFTLSKVKNGSIVFSEKMKSASLEDADTVCDRLTTAVIKQKRISSTKSVDKITEEETKGTTVKTKVTRQFYIGFGPAGVSNMETSNGGLNIATGYLFGLDHQFSLRVNAEHINIKHSEASMTDFGLGGQYYLTRQSISPYVVGMITYNWAESHIEKEDCLIFCGGEKENGFGARVGVGMHFFRTSTVNLAVEAVYNQSFFELREETPGAYGLKIIALW